MPIAFPVSAPVDTFMQSATQADMQAAVGGTFFTGAIIDYVGTTAPTGWVILDGTSIGSATSGATGRANADTANLYALFWDNYPDSSCPVSGGRGASAAADFAANKTLTLLDGRGRASIPYFGLSSFSQLGLQIGEELHLLDITEIPSHTHTVFGPTVSVGNQTFDETVISNGSTVDSGASGGGLSHNNIQPSLVIGCRIVKL